MNTFTVVNDEMLAATIGGCRQRLVYIAPGVTQRVAEAIGRLFEREPAAAVTIIIDSDPEVCRLGYGTVEGLKALHDLVDRHHIGLRSQPGLRVGVLACDGELLVYAPTPCLIEAGSHTHDKPNAIVIGCDPLAQILTAAAAEGAPDVPLAGDAEIGRDALTPQVLTESLADLERIQAKAFNVSRVERVFNSQLQYVELEVTGYKLSSRKVAIPNDLLIGEDPDLEKRLRNTFSLLEGKVAVQVEIASLDPKTMDPLCDREKQPLMVTYSEKQLEDDRKKVYKDFLVNVPSYGWLIKRWDRPNFDLRIAWFQQRIEAYRDGISEGLEKSVSESIKTLATALMPSLRERFPARLSKFFNSASPSEDEMQGLIEQELQGAFRNAQKLIKPEIKVVFKDLTYETIKEPKFREALEKAYGQLGQPSAFSQLFEEFDAARESEQLAPGAST